MSELRKVVAEYELSIDPVETRSEDDTLEGLIAQVRKSAKPRAKRELSDEARMRIAAAHKKRWAAFHRAKKAAKKAWKKAA